jgi:hypothetical protein
MVDRVRHGVAGAPSLVAVSRARRSALGWRLVALGVMGSPLAWGLVACSEAPTKIQFETGGAGGGTIPSVDPTRIETCGVGAIDCGTGCCAKGNSCSKELRCAPDTACTTSNDCGGDSFCGPGRCVAWAELPATLRKATECRDKVDLPSVIPEVQCSWPGATPPSVAPLSVQVVSTPMVVDFDFDNGPEVHPSIVFVSYEKDISSGQGTLRVIDGEDCTIQASIAGEVPFDPEVSVALGDLNGDGRPDIVAADQDRRGVAPVSGVSAYEAVGNGTTDFRKIARRQSSSTSLIKGLALHDLDDNDIPEVLTEDTLIAYNPAEKTLVDLVGIRQHLAAASLDSTPGLEPPVVMDIDGDQRAEMITSQGVFMWDTEAEDIKDKPDRGGRPIWNSNQSVSSTFVALANLGEFQTNLSGGTDSAEMVVVGFNGQLLVKQIDGETLLNVSKIGYSGGPPVIADFDGDGRMEFASPGKNFFTVFDLDCADDSKTPQNCGGGKSQPNADAVMWSSQTQGARSGAAVFDFDGDGKAEVVYADQCFMRVYDGTTGTVLFSVPRSSTTAYEYPVVADTDGDTFSELVTTSNDNDISLGCPATDLQNHNATVNFAKSHGVTVWKEKDDRWAGSRPVWNQHAYFVANVNDDGTIPRMTAERSSWNTARGGGPNTYRQNVQGATGFSLDKVDLTTSGVPKFDCVGSTAKVHVDVCNRGLEPAGPGTATAALIEAGNPRKVLCRLTSTAALAPGQCVDLSCDVPITPGGPRFDITIMGDANSQLEECNEGNNQSTISGVYCDAIPQ